MFSKIKIMKNYMILGAEQPHELVKAVNEFLTHNPEYSMLGGPYSDKMGHYQALTKNEKQQLNG
jgi:hypothetical protein